jgi:preprotein translocase subunit SecF
MNINIIGYRRIFFLISGLLILASLFSVFYFGLKQGIDLAGGANWQFQLKDQTIAESDLKSFLIAVSKSSNLVAKSLPENVFLIKLQSISEEEHQNYFRALKEKFGEIEEQSFESIGPTIGQELKWRFIWAFSLGLLGILLYVAWAFRKISYPIKSWKYGAIGILCLFHDILIPSGVMAFLGWRQGIEIDTNFIVALLFILGYSINNVIIVFDRVRENLLLTRGGRFDFADLLNNGIKQTFSRSLNTSLTTILPLLALYFLGPVSLKYFILVLILGIILGAYTSICIASPLLYVWHRKK